MSRLGKRLDQLEEALTIIRSLWHDEETNFKGAYYQVEGAVCSPKPLNPRMRLWIGGRGKRRTPRLAAKYGDGFNMPYLPPNSVADRLQRVRVECDALDRDPEEIDTSVNVGFYMNSKRVPDVNPEGSLVGTTQQTIDRIGEYSDSGVQGLNIAFRPPVDWDALDAFIEEVMPVFVD